MHKCILTYMGYSFVGIDNSHFGIDNVNHILNCMGFRHTIDYKKSYPGKFKAENRHSMSAYQSMRHSDLKIINNSWFASGYVNFLNTNRPDSIVACIYMSYSMGHIPITTLTVEELRKVEIFKTWPYEQCWFCSDWEEQ